MGYKLSGFDVIGCCEIDKRMNDTYVKNHNPKYNYLEDLRDFNKRDDLPNDLYDLDILDGSPPCSTFSMAGQREKSWGVEKKFREGQKLQTLDDLAFVFIDTVAKLRPKVVIMENVEGLIKGEAWNYVQGIYKQFNDIGYKVTHFLAKGEDMGIPQRRHRVFFIATRLDFNIEKIDFSFDYEPVYYKEIKFGELKQIGKDTEFYKIALQATEEDKSIADTRIRLGKKGSAFQTLYARENIILPTLRAKPDVIDVIDKNNIGYISVNSIISSQTFPQDYDFGNTSYTNVGYICGMSVPPVMIKRITQKLLDSGIFEKGITSVE